jgi:hypothetical protein
MNLMIGTPGLPADEGWNTTPAGSVHPGATRGKPAP